MNRAKRSTLGCIPVCAIAAALGFASPVSASDPPDAVLVLPAGLACSFDLEIDIWGGNQVYREFFDHDGNVVRTLSAGTGSALTLVNVGTGATLSLKANGAVGHVIKGPDGVDTWVLTGHNVVILFPTDYPAGPSTTLYVGRVVFTVDSSFTFTMQGSSGQKTDICAVLS